MCVDTFGRCHGTGHCWCDPHKIQDGWLAECEGVEGVRESDAGVEQWFVTRALEEVSSHLQ